MVGGMGQKLVEFADVLIGLSLQQIRVQVQRFYCPDICTVHKAKESTFSYPLFLGIFFVLPCIESYQKVDLRTITLGVPPQEVRSFKKKLLSFFLPLYSSFQLYNAQYIITLFCFLFTSFFPISSFLSFVGWFLKFRFSWFSLSKA